MLCAVLVLALQFFPLANGADDVSAAARASLERLQTLRKERPGDGILVFYEALLRTRMGEREPVLALLRSLKGRKLGLIPTRNTGFDTLWNEQEFQAIRKELAEQEPAMPNSPVAFRLKDPRLIPEGIAYDAVGQRFFLGSVAQHRVIVTDGKGETQDFSSAGDQLDAVLGLSVDSPHGCLYAVSTNNFEESGKKERRNTVVRYDLKTGRLTDRFVAPEAAQLNDLTVAPDGTLYVTDSGAGSLFRKKRDETKLLPFGGKGKLPGANGITLSSDGMLYVTLSTGIARIDTKTGEPVRLPQPDTVATGGCDGLYWHEGDLFGIQNTANPGRVIRMALSEKGTRISGVTVLQSHHHPEFDEPTTGAIANGALNVIANSYVGHYQPDGSIKNLDDLKGTTVIAVPLRRTR
ncbi:MAG TPA: hypothetical protein VGI60_03690 [Chthoniobacterales bacterium]|jgi:DNA-binding beta-propeller fold protein YncE